jgi:hypothetical protein
MKLIYLSAPYTTGPDSPSTRQDHIDKATAWLMRNTEVYIFSPITYEKPLKEFYGTVDASLFSEEKKNEEWKFWGPRDAEMVSRCDEVWVLCLHNWHGSRGVNYEVAEATKLGKPIHYIEVEEVTEPCKWCQGTGYGRGRSEGWSCDYCTNGKRGTGEVKYHFEPNVITAPYGS